jgi:hypothetical protein
MKGKYITRLLGPGSGTLARVQYSKYRVLYRYHTGRCLNSVIYIYYILCMYVIVIVYQAPGSGTWNWDNIAPAKVKDPYSPTAHHTNAAWLAITRFSFKKEAVGFGQQPRPYKTVTPERARVSVG